MSNIPDTIAEMAFPEKSAWAMVAVSAVALSYYLVAILGRAGDQPLAQVPYVGTMLWTIGGAIVASIVLHILLAIASPKEADKKDQRDREIERFSEHVGRSFVVIGGLAAMVMAMFELQHFWIANAIYLGFALSGLLESVTKIVAYRRGFQQA